MKLLQSCLPALCLFAAAMNTNTARNPVKLASRVVVLSSAVGSVLCQDSSSPSSRSPGSPPSAQKGLRIQSPRVHGETIDGIDLLSEGPTSKSGSNDDPERPTCPWNNAAPGCQSDQTLPTGKDDGDPTTSPHEKKCYNFFIQCHQASQSRTCTDVLDDCLGIGPSDPPRHEDLSTLKEALPSMLKEALLSVLKEILPSMFEEGFSKLNTNTGWGLLGLIITIVVGLIQLCMWSNATGKISDVRELVGRIRVRDGALMGDGIFHNQEY